MKIEYRVRKIERFIVTRHQESDEGTVGSTIGKGEYSSPSMAYEVAYALCKAEHDTLGYPPGDERITYPAPVQPPTNPT